MAFPHKLPFILDGASGTMFQKAGMTLGYCTEKWALENPEEVIKIQRAYVEAGSDAVYAPTFGANRPSLDRHGIDISVREMCSRLVEISRKAVSGNALVGGDIAPCGLQMEPFGQSSFDDLIGVFSEVAEGLESAGVDFFAVESQISLEETKATVTAVKRVSAKPVIVSFACGDTGKSIWGDDLAEAVTELEPLGIDAYGVNCCGDIDLLIRLVKEIREKTTLPILVKPNAGIPVMDNGKILYNLKPEELAGRIPELRSAGADIFGGCCGTEPEHIRAIKEVLIK